MVDDTDFMVESVIYLDNLPWHVAITRYETLSKYTYENEAVSSTINLFCLRTSKVDLCDHR
jgi:hypothetical protein